jgi:hypothetical protein
MRLHKNGLVFLVIFTGGCGPSEQGPRTIADAIGPDGHFRGSVPTVQIEAILPKQSDPLQYVSELAALSKRLAFAVHAKAADLPPGATALDVKAYRPDIDQYGNERPNSFALVQFDIAVLKSAHIDHLDELAALDLAKDVRPEAAYQDDIATWCKGQTAASHFCALAGSTAGGKAP